MDFELFRNCALLLVASISFIAPVCIIFCTTIVPQIKRFNDNKSKEIENEKAKLYSNISPDKIEEEIDRYISNYIYKYIFYNFTINDIDFIKKVEIDKMVKILDKQIVLELSELYLFYIKMIVNISSDDDLVMFIDRKVKHLSLELITKYNEPK